MRNEKLKRVLGILLCLVLLVQYVPVTARAADAPETLTIYFQNNWLWTDVCIYYWDSNGNNSWPGSSMQLVENDGTYDIYRYEVPVNVTGIIINGIKDDGSGNRDQTPDITGGWYDGICYYMHWDNGNHVGSFAEYCEHAGMTRTDNEDGATHKVACPVADCGYTVEEEDHTYEDGTCVCGAVCGHDNHDTDGKCIVCGAEVSHSFDTQGKCACGAECPHTTKTEGVCDTCGKADAHICTYDNGFCEKVAGEIHYEPAVLNGDGWYEISNAGQLYWFADKVDNDNANFGSAKVVLTEDITVNSGTVTAESTGLREWNPIGETTKLFRGTFDGNGKTVSGLYCVSQKSVAEDQFINDNIGLIGHLDIIGMVKNVTVTNSYLYGNQSIGGIVGYNSGTVTNCRNEATISGKLHVGGIVGYNNYGRVELSGNNGIIGNGSKHLGGIVGTCAGNTVSNCWNTGTVSGVSEAGGIVGYSNGSVLNCWNTGKVTTVDINAGGIVGSNDSKANATLIENCWSTGTVSSDKDRDTVGGVAGISIKGEIRNCYSLMNPVGVEQNAPTVTNVQAKTEAQFASGEVAYLLQTRAAESTNVWGQDLDNGKTVQTVPTFDGADVYQITANCAGGLGYSNTNEDKIVHSYNDNGFCTNPDINGDPCDAYQPAQLLTAAKCAELGLDASYEGYYAITNAGQLYWFADKVDNENATFGSANVVLTEDITVNSGAVTAESTGLRKWEPIGHYHYDINTNTTDNRSFKGIFDGNNKTVSGLYLNDPEVEYAGLIARADQGFQVKNVTLSNSYLRGSICVGGIVAYCSDGTIIGCVNNATIYGSGTDNEAGGIVGTIYTSTITDCVNNGTVCNDTSVAGGVACEQFSANMERCVNTGAVHGAARAGGVVGYSAGTIRDCENSGTITSDGAAGGVIGVFGTAENCGNSGTVTGREAGGIFGYDGNVVNCWNTGTIHGTSCAGGIEGYNDFPWTPRTIENCWSTGAVTCDENGIAGGILAYSKCGGQIVKNSYSVMEPIGEIDEKYAAATVTDVESKTLEQFASGEVAYLLRTRVAEGTENVWGQDLDNGKAVQTVPTFDGAPVYRGYTACTDTAAKYTNDSAISPDPIPHDWEYTADGAQITAECKYGCGTQGGKVTLTAPGDTVYDGAEKTVTAEGTLAGIDTLPAVTYQGDRVNVGTFTAKLTVGDATAQLPVQILPYELEVKTFVPQEKIYDGTTTCGIKTLTFVSTANGEELVLGTDFTAELTFPDKNAGEYDDAVLTVTLLDTAKANNYVLTESTVTGVIHSITPATITVTDVKVADKVYDGTTDVTVTGVVISGNLPGDDVKVTVEAALADKNSGEEKTVNLTFTLAGNDAGNYVLAEDTGTTSGKVTVKPLEEILEPVKDLTLDNVTSDDKETLEEVKEELEFVLTDEGLSDEQRKEREDALKDVQDMLDRIQDAADAITTDPILDTKDITADNITFDDREDVEQALEDLYGALEDYENNYTDAEKEGIHDDIERLEAALAALKQVEDLIKDIEELPEEVQPDTPYRKDILDAKDAYDALDDHQKGLIPEEAVQKQNDLLADLKVYLIIKGDGQTWSEGELSLTANGPLDLFMELQIDGNTVAASNYTAVSGSTIVTLKESYAQTLTAGKHSIKFVYPDGEAVGSFTVVIPTNGSAETGDEAQILFWSAAMVVSLAALAVMMAGSKKRRYAK